MSSLQIEDIQGIILSGYGRMTRACYILLAVDDPNAVKEWLRGLQIRTGAPSDADVDACTNIAFTRQGLSKLGINGTLARAFAGEFYEGMTSSEHRRRILGDVGESRPENWRWGGPENPDIDILLMCYGSTDDAYDRLLARHQKSFAESGLRVVRTLDSNQIPEHKEHFGFRDGIAQPAIEGLHNGAPDHNTIAAGEFILGYPNAYGQYADRPMVDASADPENVLPSAPEQAEKHDLGLNGSYLVFRQLSQNVTGFWQYVDAHCGHGNGVSRSEARVKLAAKMVGRWPSGAPLVKAADSDQPELGRENDFLYYGSEDGAGLKCPIGSHIRRTNPRDALEPEPGSDRSIDIGKRHRILRRGRAYGRPVAVSMDPTDILDSGDASDEERGLHFLCFNAHVGRQFEFIQHTWVNNPKFDGLYEDDDPLIGGRGAPLNGSGGSFTVQAEPVRTRVGGMPRFVEVKGGAYFFMPGVRAIRYLASASSST